MADTDSGGVASERDAAVGQDQGTGASDAGIVGDTGSDVIGGGEVAGSGESGGRDAAQDPDLEPIRGGDVSQTPAAQGGTRGAGTGADVGTGGEVGTTQPGSTAAGDQT